MERMICWNCSVEITIYYHRAYRGSRGKCPVCKVDFPLE